MKKTPDVWNGEARGSGDVVFSRLKIYLRNNPDKVSSSWENIWPPFAALALAHYCEENNKSLIDVLEDAYLRIKE